MPIIAPIKETTFLQPNNPVPVSSSEDARITGQSVAAAGQGVVSLGSAVAEIAERAERARKLSEEQVLQSELEKRSMNAYADTLNKDSSVDGGTLFKTFDDLYAQEVKSVLGDKPSDGAKAIASGIASKRYKELLDARLEKTKLYSNTAAEMVLASKLALIEQFPDKHDDTMNEFYTHIDRVGGLVGFAEPTKIKMAAGKEGALAAIRGYVHLGKYDVAREMLTQKYAGFMKSEDVAATRDFIDKREHEARSNQLRELEVIDKLSKRTLEQVQRGTYQALSEISQTALTFAQRERIRTDVDTAHRSGKVTDAQRSILHKMLDRKEVGDNKDAVYDVKRRIKDGAPAARLYKEIDAMVEKEVISPKTGIDLYNQIKQHQNKSKSNPEYKAQVKKFDKRLEALLSGGLPIKYLEPARKAQLYQVQDKMEEYRKSNSPRKAYEMVLKEYVSDLLSTEFVPGIDSGLQTSPQGIARAAEQIAREVKAGKRTQKQAVEAFKILERRKKAIEEMQMVNPAYDKKEKKQ